MRIFQTKWFARFARKERIALAHLRDAVARAENGVIDADLGGHLIKQRINRAGQGRSGGYRTVIAYHTQTRSVFIYGFAKSQRDNIDEDDLVDIKKLARKLLALDDQELELALQQNELIEVQNEEDR